MIRPQTRTLKSNSYEIRALEFEGCTFFSVRDILSACKIQYAAKWVSRARKVNAEELQMKKLRYPLITSSGKRAIDMWFVDRENGCVVLNLVSCSDDVRKWLEDDVFSFRFESVNQMQQNKAPASYAKPEMPSSGAINAMIDSILIELLELKKALIQTNI